MLTQGEVHGLVCRWSEDEPTDLPKFHPRQQGERFTEFSYTLQIIQEIDYLFEATYLMMNELRKGVGATHNFAVKLDCRWGRRRSETSCFGFVVTLTETRRAV